MLMRTDPFQELDRLTRQMFGTVARLDAYRKGEEFYVHFDLPGVDAGSIELEVERNMLAEEGGHDDATG
ncbi:MAG: Hsp20 family protein, partial [Haloechinothrix sp.]